MKEEKKDEVLDPPRELEMYSLDDLASSGLLWLINRTVFHPRGFALNLNYGSVDEHGAPVDLKGWSIISAGEGEPFTYALPPEIEDQRFRSIEAILAFAREYGEAPSQKRPVPKPLSRRKK